MNIHVKVVAVLHILSGVLGLIAAIVIFAVFGVAGGIVNWQGEHGAATIIGIVAILIGGFLAVLALPGIIGGCGLLAHKEWARVLVIVLGILHAFYSALSEALQKGQELVGWTIGTRAP